MLRNYKAQHLEDMDELIGAAVLIGQRPNYLTVDEHGFYHVQASGKVEEVITAMYEIVHKLERIKKQRDSN